MIVFLWGKNI